MNLVYSNSITRVLQMILNSSTATCFTTEYNGEQYLITAKHVFENIGYANHTTIQVYQEHMWKNLDVDVFYHEIKEIDIAIMKFALNSITQKLPIEYNCNNICYSQDAFFLGFPFGCMMDNFSQNSGYPVPLIKKCTVSGIMNENNISYFLLDGQNNQGFSGGPVIFNEILTDKNEYKSEYKICAVISGYRFYSSPVFDQSGSQVPFFTKENAGLIIAYDIKYAFEIIKKIK